MIQWKAMRNLARENIGGIAVVSDQDCEAYGQDYDDSCTFSKGKNHIKNFSRNHNGDFKLI